MLEEKMTRNKIFFKKQHKGDIKNNKNELKEYKLTFSLKLLLNTLGLLCKIKMIRNHCIIKLVNI